MTVTSTEGGWQVSITLPPITAPTAAERRRAFVADVAKSVCGGVLLAAILGVGGAAWKSAEGTGAKDAPGSAPSCVEVLHRVTADARTNPDEVEILLKRNPDGLTLVTREEFIACGLDGQVRDAADAGLG